MSLPERSPHIRALPRAATLDILLKNTHFPDGLLAREAPIECRVEWDEKVPVLVFAFQLASYDFSEPLLPAELRKADQGWLDQQPIQIRLLLADNVITDHVTERLFLLPVPVSDQIRKVFKLADTEL